jgi:hypothetical protein
VQYARFAENPPTPQRAERAGRVCNATTDDYHEPGRRSPAQVYRDQCLSIVCRDA